MENLKSNILNRFLFLLQFENLNANILDKIAMDIQEPKEVILLLFPSGIRDLIDFYFQNLDERLSKEEAKEPSMTDRIKTLTIKRFHHLYENQLAVKKITRWLACNGPIDSKKRTFKTADLIWKLAGDTATDFNFYTKRLILQTIYEAALARFISSGNLTAIENQINLAINLVIKMGKKIS